MNMGPRDGDPNNRKSGKQFKSDFEWFASNPPELQEYRGKHIAIFNQEIIGSGNTSVEAYRQAKQKISSSNPALAYVQDTPVGIF